MQYMVMSKALCNKGCIYVVMLNPCFIHCLICLARIMLICEVDSYQSIAINGDEQL